MFRNDTYCGLNCGACPVLVANKNGTVDQRAAEWNMPAENLKCHGCKTDQLAVYCVKCDMRDCARQKNIAFCFECDEFPCETIVNFNNDKASHHSAALHNLYRIRDIGLDDWLTEQNNRWQCPECGTPFTWYEETCAACNGRLFSCRDEEQRINNPE